MSAFIPVIDLTRSRQSNAVIIDAACRESGFLVVSGHGIDPDLVSRTHEITLALFQQPDSWKLRWTPPADAVGLRGMHLTPSNVSAPENVTTASDLCQLFTMSRLGEPGVAASAGLEGAPDGWYSANIWPDQPTGLRDVWLEYYAAMETLSSELIRLFALGLGLGEGHFDEFVDEHITNLTANFYPPIDEPPLDDQFRKGPHSDWGTLTILSQDGTGGLEVFDRRDSTWVDVPAIAGAFVVNIGDLMAAWTNDRWQSTKHRVRVPPPARRRIPRVSLAFFHHPNWNALIECLPSCVQPGDAPLHPPVTAGAYLMNRVAVTYT